MNEEQKRISFLASLATAAPLAAASTLTSCEPVGGPDLGPVGDGLSFMGICFVVGVLIFVIGVAR